MEFSVCSNATWLCDVTRINACAVMTSRCKHNDASTRCARWKRVLRRGDEELVEPGRNLMSSETSNLKFPLLEFSSNHRQDRLDQSKLLPFMCTDGQRMAFQADPRERRTRVAERLLLSCQPWPHGQPKPVFICFSAFTFSFSVLYFVSKLHSHRKICCLCRVESLWQLCMRVLFELNLVCELNSSEFA